ACRSLASLGSAPKASAYRPADARTVSCSYLGQGEPLAVGRRLEVAARGDQSFGPAFRPAFASCSASSFLKSSRPRSASQCGSLSLPSQPQPWLKASRREATAWSAKAAASAFVTPDFASPPSPASRASARDRSNRIRAFGSSGGLGHCSGASTL